ncbi:DUF4194 domain-containing protein [Pseudomonas sp. CFII68]|uniref:DUF4194 domain-containing protein n=1 Tax=Pseudomonas sp. CFII68 TaxID=911243 RepID=UPI0003552721|nr:DUF4194 domain-containing protein [Pseudomonas sp. CFII68]EPJ88288.1 hypothetical protein CFII68_11399 [Pseudomonas sp. CFII68]
MNWSEELNTDSPGAATTIDEAGPDALFINDCGELPLDTRRALVQLLSGPSLDGRRHPKLWPILIRDEAVIRRRLADLFLDLVIDIDLQVAFIRQVDTGDIEAPRLLRRAQLTFIDSILLLHLRHLLTQAESHGERAVVSTEEIVEFLHIYERIGSTDQAGFTKRIYASIEKIKKHSILQKIRASENRFEVSPTLKLLFSAEEIQALTRLYLDMAAGDIPMGEETAEPGEETDE